MFLFGCLWDYPRLWKGWWDELVSLYKFCYPNWCVGGNFNVMRDFDTFIR